MLGSQEQNFDPVAEINKSLNIWANFNDQPSTAGNGSIYFQSMKTTPDTHLRLEGQAITGTNSTLSSGSLHGEFVDQTKMFAMTGSVMDDNLHAVDATFRNVLPNREFGSKIRVDDNGFYSDSFLNYFSDIGATQIYVMTTPTGSYGGVTRLPLWGIV